MKNPFAFKCLILVDTNANIAMPIGYLTQCGIPIMFGMMYRILKLDFSIPIVKSEHPVI